jgi:hypothetical protein
MMDLAWRNGKGAAGRRAFAPCRQRSVAGPRTIGDLHASVLQFAHPIGGGDALVGLAKGMGGITPPPMPWPVR